MVFVVDSDYEWRIARELYLKGDSGELERLLHTDKKISVKTRRLLADIVSGKSKVKMTGKKNRKIPLLDELKISDSAIPLAYALLCAPGGVEWLADSRCEEVGAMRKKLEESTRTADKKAAKTFDVAAATIRKLRGSTKFDKLKVKPKRNDLAE
jgi:hypothetical protein